jgi:tryptophanyl-tRNA synthetase
MDYIPTFQAETLQSAAMYVASGIDPTRSKIFVQSHVRAHTEMTWYTLTFAAL